MFFQEGSERLPDNREAGCWDKIGDWAAFSPSLPSGGFLSRWRVPANLLSSGMGQCLLSHFPVGLPGAFCSRIFDQVDRHTGCCRLLKCFEPGDFRGKERNSLLLQPLPQLRPFWLGWWWHFGQEYAEPLSSYLGERLDREDKAFGVQCCRNSRDNQQIAPVR